MCIRDRGKIAAHGGILGVHGIAGGYKSYHAAGTHLVECFGEKVVMNTEIQLVVGFVIDLILTEKMCIRDSGKPVLRLSGLSPFRHDVQRAVPLLEEDDVRYHLGTGILFERLIRQTESSLQRSTLGKICLLYASGGRSCQSKP